MLKLLRQIVEEMNAAQDLSKALHAMVSKVGAAIDAQSCAVYLADYDTKKFNLSAALGPYEPLVDRASIPFGQGLVSVVAKREQLVNIANAPAHPNYAPIPIAGIEKYHGYLGVPIQQQRQLLGILVVRQQQFACFDEAEEAFLLTIASQLARVIAQTKASVKTDQSNEEKQTKRGVVLTGIPSVPGVAIGQAVVVFPLADLDAIPEREAENIDGELINFRQALSSARDEMRILGERLAPNLPAEEQVLFEAYLKLLDSNTLIMDIEQEIKQGFWAQSALKRVIKRHGAKFRGIDNEYLRDRASDLDDLGQRILSHLQQNNQQDIDYFKQTILVGNEVMASNLAEVPEGQLCGVISAKGSSNSHVAILARALGIPTVMGTGPLPIATIQKQTVIVDGYNGQAYLSPTRALLSEYRKLAKEEHELDTKLEALRELPAQTKDGHRLALYVNTGLIADVSRSLTAGAEGVGLYRTEVPFMIRDRFPTGEEQRVNYRQMLSAFSPLPVVMRVLDIGGDKQLPYFPIQDDNPFLGWRGIRMLLDHPEIFQSQVKAMMQASHGYKNLSIMLPMISDTAQVDEAINLLQKAYRDVAETQPDIPMPKIGAMIEIPSAVYQAAAIAKRVDFLSVGSNDLTQYMLAVDRNNSRVATFYDAFHPALLQALYHTVKGAHSEGKSISICGEMAGDPMAVVLLLAMGFDTLSMSATALPRVKWVIRHFTISRARKLLTESLWLDNSSQVKQQLKQALDELGLGGLIRAGKK